MSNRRQVLDAERLQKKMDCTVCCLVSLFVICHYSQQVQVVQGHLTDQFGRFDVRSWTHVREDFIAHVDKPILITRVRIIFSSRSLAALTWPLQPSMMSTARRSNMSESFASDKNWAAKDADVTVDAGSTDRKSCFSYNITSAPRMRCLSSQVKLHMVPSLATGPVFQDAESPGHI
jgi:hypothetical protein